MALEDDRWVPINDFVDKYNANDNIPFKIDPEMVLDLIKSNEVITYKRSKYVKENINMTRRISDELEKREQNRQTRSNNSVSKELGNYTLFEIFFELKNDGMYKGSKLQECFYNNMIELFKDKQIDQLSKDDLFNKLKQLNKESRFGKTNPLKIESLEDI